MSTTTTSLAPYPSLSSGYNTAIQATQKTASQASQAITTASSHVSQQVQSLGLTPRPSTPKAAEVSTPASTPGKFRHPMTTEILRRNAASSLTERDVKGAVTNAAALLLSFIFSDVYYSNISPLLNSTGLGDSSLISSTTLLLIRLLFCFNIILLLRPVIPHISKKDEINDIPLTPSQRQLLGLNPSVQSTPTSADSAAGFITPPRYRRLSASQFSSGTPTSTDRRSISANYSSSPLSTSRHSLGFSQTPSQSAVTRRAASGSPFSPSPTASPLFQKAIMNQNQSQISDIDFSTSTLSSFGASTSSNVGGSGLSRSQSMRERQRPRRESLEPNSPSPTRGPQIVPGFNYKWLYDKGREIAEERVFL